MSKYLGLLSNGSGKIGEVVLQRNNVQRVRVREIKNPRTQGQQIARMIAATATRTYSALKGIVDHSFQGVPYGGKSMNYFLKNAMRDLRARAAFVTEAGGEEMPFTFGFSPKNLRGAVPGEFLVADGSLPSIATVETARIGAVDQLAFKFNGIAADSFPVPSHLWGLGVKGGDQITFLCVDCTGPLNGINIPVVRVNRVVLTAEFNNPSGAWSADYFDGEKSDESLVSGFLNSEAKISESVFNGTQISVGYGCVILSRPGKTVWERSHETLKLAGDGDLAKFGPYWYNAALTTWTYFGESLGESDRYLNEGDL